MAVLLTYYLDERPQTVRGLAAQLNVSKSVVSRSLDRLGELRLVSRVPEPGDRRSVVMDQTSAGRTFMANLRG